MAYKEVARVEITEVTRHWQAGSGIREITRSTGLARNTIRKYTLTAQSCGLVCDGPPPAESQLITLVQLNRAGPHQVVVPTNEVLEPRTDQIEQWLKHDRLKLTRIHELLGGTAWYLICPYAVLLSEEAGRAKKSRTTVRMADTEPGEVAEADFGRLGLMWNPQSGRRRFLSQPLSSHIANHAG